MFCQIQTVVECVVSEGGVAVLACGAPFVIASPLGGDLFVGKHNSCRSISLSKLAMSRYLVTDLITSTPGTVLLWVLGLDGAGVPGLQVDVRGPVLRSVLVPVAHPAVDVAVGAVVVVERVQHVVTSDTTETVTVEPFPISCHHLLSLKNLPTTFRAAVGTVFLRLDDPGLHCGPRQHIVLVVVKL